MQKKRLGFTDVVVDNGQVDILRRHLMFMAIEDKDPCQTWHSLSARVALNFSQQLPETIGQRFSYYSQS